VPIDFKNNCNIGYAFLNFIEPKYMINFVLEFHGKKWDLQRSEKVHFLLIKLKRFVKLIMQEYKEEMN